MVGLTHKAEETMNHVMEIIRENLDISHYWWWGVENHSTAGCNL